MFRSEQLAVLTPVFNGGELLRHSVLSCAQAGLDPGQYEIIVSDNCSIDGCADQLPAKDANGAIIQVHHNAANIGRVGNWNRCIEIALTQGFRYVTFLFAGDCWLPNGSLPDLFSLMRERDAAIGLSPFTISDERGATKRASQRFYTVNRGSAVTSTRRFLSTMLESGLFPLGPLQANVYRISHDHVIRFDESLPTRTDVAATLEFVAVSERPVVIVSKPFFQWQERPGRFHASMGVRQTMRDYLDTFHSASERTRIPVDYCRAKTRVMLNCLRLISRDAPVREWAALLDDLVRYSRSSPYRGSLFHVFEAFWLRFALGRRLLELS